jgi:hypothetical protein
MSLARTGFSGGFFASAATVVLWTLLMLCAPAAASADPITASNAEQFGAALQKFQEGQRLWLKISQAYLRPCYLNKHEKCRENMREALNTIPQRVEETGTALVRYLMPVRNGQFMYEPVFSVLLLDSIVSQGGGCEVWQSRASDHKGQTLSALMQEASREIGARTSLPESKRLDELSRLTSPCGVTRPLI